MITFGDYKDRDDRLLAPWARMALAAGGSYAAWKVSGKIPLGHDPRKLRWLAAGFPEWANIGRPVTARDWLWNVTKGFEEHLGGLPRTFELSSLMSRGSLRTATWSIGGEELYPFQKYYGRLFGRTLSPADIQAGIQYRAGRVFIGQTQIPGRWELTQRLWAPGTDPSRWMHSRLARAFQTVRGVRAVPAPSGFSPDVGSKAAYLITGGKTGLGMRGRTAQAYLTTLSHRYFRLLDEPVEFLGELLRTQKFQKFFDKHKRLSDTYNFWLKNRLGLGRGPGKELGGLTKLWGRHAGQLGKYLVLGGFAYRAADQLVADIAPDWTIFGGGITSAGAETIAGVRGFYAGVSQITGLTTLRRQQEEISPGSAGKGTMAAFPLAGLTTGAVLAGTVSAYNLFKRGPAALELNAAKAPIKGFMSKLPFMKGQYSRLGRWSRYGALIGTAVSGLISLPTGLGWIGSKYTPDELEDIYSGETEVAVKKGRMWEFSKTPYEGGAIDYYRPHLFALARSRYKEKALFQGNESFLFKAAKQTEIIKDIVDPYFFERELREERPYPLAQGESTGLGPLSSVYNLTLGRVFKPRRFLHRGEWDYQGSGGTGPGGDTVHIGVDTPHGFGAEAESFAQRVGDAFGLVGFLGEAVHENITGEKTWFGKRRPELQSAAEIASGRRSYWDLNLGGFAGVSEFYRRLQPPRRYGEVTENTILNRMPSWLPKTGSGSLNFSIGDPYCVSLDTLVETGPLSYVPAGNNPSSVINHKGEQVAVKASKKRSLRPGEKAYDIRLRGQKHVPLKISEGHPFLTSNGWVEAKDLKVKDEVIYPVQTLNSKAEYIDLGDYFSVKTDRYIYPLSSQDTAEATEYIDENGVQKFRNGQRKKFLNDHNWSLMAWDHASDSRKRSKIWRIPRFIPITKELGYLLGILLGDGSCDEKRGRITVFCHKKELKDRTEAIQKVLTQFRDPRPKTIRPYSGEGNGVAIEFSSKPLALIALDYIGKLAHKKSLSNKLINWDPESVASLIKGYLDSDGCLSKSKYGPVTSFKSVNLKLLLQVRKLIWMVAGPIKCYISSDKPGFHSYPNGRSGFAGASFALRYSHRQTERVLEALETPRKQEPFDITQTITSIEEISLDEVIGFEVPVGDSFCLVGAATHNTKIPMGEARLPGRGFSAIHPELTGILPEDYPTAWRYKILADVAPYSREAQRYRAQVRRLAETGSLTEREQRIWSTTEEQLAKKSARREFAPEPTNIFAKFFQATKATGRLSPLEHLIPFSPIAKLAGPMTAIEDYKTNMVYSREYASWSSPISHFLKPTYNVIRHAAGWSGIPGEIQEQRDIQEYFDKLEYLKASMHESGRAKRRTLTGVNPFGPEQTLFRAMEGRERYYYHGLRGVEGAEHQREVLKYVPDQYRKIYRAAWAAEEEEKILALGGNRRMLRQIQLLRNIQGEEISPELAGQYRQETGQRALGPDYANWKREQDVLHYFEDQPLPGPDWAGWMSGLDLEDVKLKLIKNVGKEIHDYNLWESREANIDNPALTKEAAAQLANPDLRSASEIQTQLMRMLHGQGIEDLQIRVDERQGFNSRNQVELIIQNKERGNPTNKILRMVGAQV